MIDKINIRSYGRVKARKLSEQQTHLLENVLPQYELPLDADIQTLKAQNYHIWLEIGFGTGARLLHVAQANPDVLFIGAEPFINGVAFCLAGIEAQKLQNIRIFPADVRLLLANLSDSTLERVDILFPDPWRKRVHHKRRLINAEMLAQIARIMKTRGELHIATYHSDYLTWILQHLKQTPQFELVQASHIPPHDWLQTRYEGKAKQQGRIPTFLQLIKI